MLKTLFTLLIRGHYVIPAASVEYLYGENYYARKMTYNINMDGSIQIAAAHMQKDFKNAYLARDSEFNFADKNLLENT